MTIEITTRFSFSTDQPTDLLLQFEAANIPEQTVQQTTCTLDGSHRIARITSEDDVGERIWMRAEGRVDVEYSATVELERLAPDIAALDQLAPHDLPAVTVKYLLDSRYCPSDRFQSFVNSEFQGTSGGKRVLAIRDWIADHFSYEPGSSDANTTSVDSFVERRGICRDYAHVLIAMTRASTIPARFVSCYAPNVDPPDFHALAEVFLADPTIEGGGAWYIVDATDMASATDTVKIGVGRDAADVSFMTSFGASRFLDKTVEVKAV